jgi:hypothetical protein
VASRSTHTQLKGHEAFLGDSDQSDQRGDSWEDAVADYAALVEHHLEFDAAPFEQRRDLASTVGATDFFVMPLREVHSSRWTKPFPQQHLHGLQRA